nr:RNA-directed DNA polymerase, eukaryota [Tanacetum cinerariifolium]
MECRSVLTWKNEVENDRLCVFSGQNIDTIIYVLKCFQRASGLCINVSNQAANRIGCGILKVPFTYLGSRVGGNMSRICSWDEIVEKLITLLSKWKMNTLSIGGRSTLLKAVLGSVPIYYMSPFKEKGGLGVSSFYALNRALMFKWVWRIKTQKEMLWSRVIKAIHGVNGRIGSHSKIGYKSIWCDIIREVETVKGLMELLEGVMLGTYRDRWYWSLDGSGEFSVSSIKKVLDDNRLPYVSSQTRWSKEMPIKVNVTAWKVRLDCLPTRLNISRRGLDIPSILCPICGIAAESTAHVFFQCGMAKDLFRKILSPQRRPSLMM